MTVHVCEPKRLHTQPTLHLQVVGGVRHEVPRRTWLCVANTCAMLGPPPMPATCPHNHRQDLQLHGICDSPPNTTCHAPADLGFGFAYHALTLLPSRRALASHAPTRPCPDPPTSTPNPCLQQALPVLMIYGVLDHFHITANCCYDHTACLQPPWHTCQPARPPPPPRACACV
jgi:hypothetical protein